MDSFFVNKLPNSTIGSSNSPYHGRINFFSFLPKFHQMASFFKMAIKMFKKVS
jgi:hypothetical protein